MKIEKIRFCLIFAQSCFLFFFPNLGESTLRCNFNKIPKDNIMLDISSTRFYIFLITLSSLIIIYIFWTKVNSKYSHPNEKLIIAVPGGGLNSGNLPQYTILRLKKALEICKLNNNEYLENCLIIPLSFGTTHKPPPRDEQGFLLLG